MKAFRCAAAAMAVAGTELVVSLFAAPGDDAGHVRGHVLTAIVLIVAGLAAATALRFGRARTPLRALAAFTGVLAVVVLVEGVAAFAYGADNTRVRNEVLHRVHNAVTTFGPLTALAVTAAVTLSSIVMQWRARATEPRARERGRLRGLAQTKDRL